MPPGADADPLPQAAEAFLVSSEQKEARVEPTKVYPIVAVLSLVILAVGIARA